MVRSLGRVALVFCALFMIAGFAETASAQYCVRYVRSLTDFDVRGDAWAWWHNAEGVYARGHVPAEGAVLVFSRSRGMPLGHVSTVSAVVDSRTILVDHSFGGPVLWRDMPVIDTSANNDWSRVRVWSGPADRLGSTDFPISGFLYPAGYSEPAPSSTLSTASTSAERAIRTVVNAAVPMPPTVVIDGATLAATVPRPDRRPAAAAPMVRIPRRAADGAEAPSAAAPSATADAVTSAGWLPPDIAGAAFARTVPQRPPVRFRGTQAAEADHDTVSIRRN